MCEIHANGIARIYMEMHVNTCTHGQAIIHYLCLPCSVHVMRLRIKLHLISGDKTQEVNFKAWLDFISGKYITG